MLSYELRQAEIWMEYQSSFIWLFDEQWMIRWKMINGNYGYSTKTKKNGQENWLSKHTEDKL